MVKKVPTGTTSISDSNQQQQPTRESSVQHNGLWLGRSSLSDADSVIETSLRQHEQNMPNNDNNQRPSPLGCFFNALVRKKPMDGRTDTNLNRCLNLIDLTTLGVGSTLGLGLYVLAGSVASTKAGPAVVISFALAALASAFSALCYAEFAGRVPKAGSAYAYSYITVGEFVAFVIGWNLVLEYVIGASTVARGFSGNLRFVYDHIAQGLTGNENILTDSLDNTGHHATHQLITSNSSVTHLSGVVPVGSALLAANSTTVTKCLTDSVTEYLIKYFDWLSVAIIVVLTIFILFGVKESTNVTLAFTGVNLIVVLTVVMSSLSSLDIHNWQLTKKEIPPNFGEGGFLPYGWSGVLAGSATCFFGFIGFDTIASSAEEAKNPKRNVPLSILLSLFISFIAYMAMATVQTLLWPYYDQNSITILPYIFERLNMQTTHWIVLLGAIAGLASSLLGGMYPLPRILYSMAQDKLIYGCLAHINRSRKLPVRATITGSVFIAVIACLLDIQDLADMVSIGTLAAYSLVSLSVLIVRYEDRQDTVDDSTILSNRLSFADILSSTSGIQSTELATVEEYGCFKKPEPQVVETVQKTKLTSKASIPIREKGSRAVVAQLSVGFQSWFKSNEFDEVVDESTQVNNSNKDIKRKKSIFDLLIKWKTDKSEQKPDDETSHQSKILIATLVLLTITFDLIVLCLTSPELDRGMMNGDQSSVLILITDKASINPKTMLICTGSIVFIAIAAILLMLSRLPTGQVPYKDMFQVPLVPLTPFLSILVNTFLMLNLSFLTWVRFTVWMTFGLFIYFSYGIWNSEGYMLRMNN